MIKSGLVPNGRENGMNLYAGNAVLSADRLTALHHITLERNPIGQSKSIWIYPHASFFAGDATARSIKDTICVLCARRTLLNMSNVGAVYRMK